MITQCRIAARTAIWMIRAAAKLVSTAAPTSISSIAKMNSNHRSYVRFDPVRGRPSPLPAGLKSALSHVYSVLRESQARDNNVGIMREAQAVHAVRGR